MSNRFERGKLPPYTIPDSFDRLGTRIVGLNEIIGGEAAPSYQIPAGTLVWDYTLVEKTSSDGLLAIDGSDVSRTTYSALFEALGVTYGVGDGTTTFGLPAAVELYSRVLGPTTGARGTYSKAILPLHQHNITTPAQNTAIRYYKNPGQVTGEYLDPGLNTLSPNHGNSDSNFKSAIHPSRGMRMAAYITTDVYTLQVGQIIYGLSDELLNYTGGKFLKCDGVSFNPATYGALASALNSTATPNLKTKMPVIRGFTAGSRSQNISRTIATHTHSSPVSFTDLQKAGMFAAASASRHSLAGPTSGSGQNLQRDSSTNSATYVLGPGGDDRPANVALDFLICAI